MLRHQPLSLLLLGLLTLAQVKLLLVHQPLPAMTTAYQPATAMPRGLLRRLPPRSSVHASSLLWMPSLHRGCRLATRRSWR